MQAAPEHKSHWVYKALIALVLINAVVTAYLVNTISTQNKRIQTLESHDSVKQSVDKLQTKYDSLKARVEGLFH